MEAALGAEISPAEKDEKLMLAYSQGDASAFQRLYERHKGAVYRFFIRQNITEAQAEELAHDTWMKLINARESYVETAKFTTYLFTIARNLMFDFQAKSSNKHEIAEDETDNKPEEQSVSQVEIHDKESLLTKFKQELEKLPVEQREIFLLKQEAGFTIEEIAQITGSNKEKVKSGWRYALQKLRRGLSDYVQ